MQVALIKHSVSISHQANPVMFMSAPCNHLHRLVPPPGVMSSSSSPPDTAGLGAADRKPEIDSPAPGGIQSSAVIVLQANASAATHELLGLLEMKPSSASPMTSREEPVSQIRSAVGESFITLIISLQTLLLFTITGYVVIFSKGKWRHSFYR